MTTLTIIGAGGHGISVADAAALTGLWSAIEFCDDERVGETRHDWKVRATVSQRLDAIASGNSASAACIVAIGNNAARLAMQRRFQEAGAVLTTVLHPSAIVSPRALIGAGTVVLASAVINIGTRVGAGVIVNTGAVVDHDCTIGDGAHICPRVALAGGVRVGDQAWVGIGASVIQQVSIGARAVVGAGGVVIRDVAEGVTAVGNPARVIDK